jgi:hypothetical protein
MEKSVHQDGLKNLHGEDRGDELAAFVEPLQLIVCLPIERFDVSRDTRHWT